MRAAEEDHIETVEILLAHPNIRVDLTDMVSAFVCYFCANAFIQHSKSARFHAKSQPIKDMLLVKELL